MLPCFPVPARMSSLFLKLALVTIHLVYVCILFLFDGDFMEKTEKEPWYIALYLLLFVATLIQYFVTSISSPGYVLDAMRAVNETNLVCRKISPTSNQPPSSKNGSFILTVGGRQTRQKFSGTDVTYWSKLVADLYPPGTTTRTWRCIYCNLDQPPRVKHCKDCGKCVLRFDHHCVWLGNCIGQGNHCRFWWKNATMILLLIILSISLIFLLLLLLFHSYLVLTNQTSYELARRRRIPYLRAIPDTVHPFSKGLCRNLYNFCCARSIIYSIEPIPTSQEIEEKSRPYTCLDIVTCHCS